MIFDKHYRETLSSNTFGNVVGLGLLLDDFCHPTSVDELCDKIETQFVEDGAVEKWNLACEAGED